MQPRRAGSLGTRRVLLTRSQLVARPIVEGRAVEVAVDQVVRASVSVLGVPVGSRA